MRLQDIGIQDPAFTSGILTPTIAPSGPTVSKPLTVWLMDEPQCPAYEAFLQRHPRGTLYHSLAWRDALAAENTGEPFYLAAMRGERVVGVLPLVERRDMWGRRRLVSLPATPIGGVVADDEEIEAALLNRATKLARSRQVPNLVIRQFVPRSASGGASVVRDWVRVPVAQFAPYVCSYPTNALTYKPTPFSPDVLELLRGGRPYAASTTNDHMLATLAKAGALTECAVACRANGDALGALVWAFYNRQLHVLAYGAIGTKTIVCRTLIMSMLEAARMHGADSIDLPLPRRFDAWFDGLAKLPGVGIAREERIALR